MAEVNEAKALRWTANMLGGTEQEKGFPRTAAYYCIAGADLIEELQRQLDGAKANGLIQQHIIENGRSPLDAGIIVRLTIENAHLKTQLTATQKCIYDIETYLKLGNAKYIKKTIDGWRNANAAK